jgi:hypothetical protein
VKAGVTPATYHDKGRAGAARGRENSGHRAAQLALQVQPTLHPRPRPTPGHWALSRIFVRKHFGYDLLLKLLVYGEGEVPTVRSSLSPPEATGIPQLAPGRDLHSRARALALPLLRRG